jgi:hypothetical protein
MGSEDNEVPPGPSSWREVSSVIGEMEPAADGPEAAPSKMLTPQQMADLMREAEPAAAEERVEITAAPLASSAEAFEAPPSPAPDASAPLPAPPGGAASSPPAPAPAAGAAPPAPVGGAVPSPPSLPPAPAPIARPPSPVPAPEAVGRAVSTSVSPTPPAEGFRWQPGEIKLVIEQGMSIGKEFLVSDPDMVVGRLHPGHRPLRPGGGEQPLHLAPPGPPLLP